MLDSPERRASAGGIQTTIEKRRPIVGLNGIERRNQILEGVRL